MVGPVLDGSGEPVWIGIPIIGVIGALALNVYCALVFFGWL
jgi:hypothetical protein